MLRLLSLTLLLRSVMKVTQHRLSPPDLDELASVLEPALKANFATASVSIEQCPDLSQSPFHLAAPGLCGSECIADVGGQPNLFPEPVLTAKYSLLDLAKHMNMSPEQGSLLGAGAGPFHVLGINSELAPNLSWKGGFENVNNQTRYAKINESSSGGQVVCTKSPSTDCALMINLFGSSGKPGPVLKITARCRKGEQNFTDCIRFALRDRYADGTPISLGGVFLIKKGKANFHVMPDFPSKDQLPFKDPKQLNDWLTYHDFDAPMVCLTVMHSADPEKKIGLRMEHTHCFASDGGNRGGHYHYDVHGEEEVEYEAYLNTAKMIYRIDRPDATLQRDLHD